MAESHKLLHHSLLRLREQIIYIGRGLPLGLDRRQNRHIDGSWVDLLALDVEDVRVVCADDGDDRDLCLDGEVEGAFLEGEERGLARVAAGAFREDVDGLALGRHCLRGRVESGAGGCAVGAVDEDGFGEGHWGAVSIRSLVYGRKWTY